MDDMQTKVYNDIIVKKCKCCIILYHVFVSDSRYFCYVKELKSNKLMYSTV